MVNSFQRIVGLRSLLSSLNSTRSFGVSPTCLDTSKHSYALVIEGEVEKLFANPRSFAAQNFAVIEASLLGKVCSTPHARKSEGFCALVAGARSRVLCNSPSMIHQHR